MAETVTTPILKKAKRYIADLFKENLSDKLLYHNYNHTSEVAEIAYELGKDSGLSQDDLETLTLAAWFHDTGYTEKYDGHEAVSADIAEQFLQQQGYDQSRIDEVKSLILSTEDSKVSGLKQELLRDADLAHLGRKRFFRKGELLRVELENYKDEEYSELEWEKKQYNFLINHTFITEAAKKAYERRRVKNIKSQRSNIHKARKVTVREQTGKDFGRGIDTLYRASYRNHINLSAIADGKANMMISINTIMISVIVTLSGASLSISHGFSFENLRYVIPILLLLIGSLVSVVFAVLSARPKVTEKNVNKEDVKRNKASLLYFGNFLSVEKNEFMDYLSNLKKDQKRLYDSMSIDLYNLGIVLKEKYRLLSVSYNAFMVGLVCTVLAFLVIFLYTNL